MGVRQSTALEEANPEDEEDDEEDQSSSEEEEQQDQEQEGEEYGTTQESSLDEAAAAPIRASQLEPTSNLDDLIGGEIYMAAGGNSSCCDGTADVVTSFLRELSPDANTTSTTSGSRIAATPENWRTTRRTHQMIEYEYSSANKRARCDSNGESLGMEHTQDIEFSSETQFSGDFATPGRNLARRVPSRPTMTISGCKLFFPQGSKPFPSQKAVMSKVLSAIIAGKNALIESPTGTGKTLAILSACLSWQRSETLKELQNELERLAAAAADKENSTTKEVQSDQEKEDTSLISSHDAKASSGSDAENAASSDESQRKAPEPSPSLNLNRRIIYVSRTHGQLQQISDEAKKCVDAAFWYERLSTTGVEKASAEALASKCSAKSFLKASADSFEDAMHVEFETQCTVLASRNRCCVNKSVKRNPSSPSVREQCADLLQRGKCPHSRNVSRLSAQLSSICDLEEVDRVVAEARKNQRNSRTAPGCPYFALKDRIPSSTIIACPYQYLIDPVIRRTSGLDPILKGSIVICDEGHNIEATASDAASFMNNVSALSEAEKNLRSIFEKYSLMNLGQPLLDVLVAMVKWAHRNKTILPRVENGKNEHSWEGNELLSIMASWGITSATLPVLRESHEQVGDELARIQRENQGISEGEEQDELMVADMRASFLSSVEKVLTCCGFALQSRNSQSESRGSEFPYLDAFRLQLCHDTYKNDLHLNLCCFDAEPCISEISDLCRSMIILSGTLSPLEKSSDEFGVPFGQKLSAPHVINTRTQLFAGVVSKLSSTCPHLKLNYKTIRDEQVNSDIGSLLCEVSRQIPGGIIVFAPSFSALTTMAANWERLGVFETIKQRSNKTIYVESYDASAAAEEGLTRPQYMEQVIGSFKQDCAEDSDRDGAMLFTVFRGTLSEGINLTDNYCRMVMVLGVPFAALKDWKIVSKRRYQDRKAQKLGNASEVRNGNDWYCSEALRASSQAAGRAIRHKNDWGSVLFVDSRYNDGEYYNKIPRWMQTQLRLRLSTGEVREGLASFTAAQRGHTYVPRDPPSNEEEDASSCSPDDTEEQGSQEAQEQETLANYSCSSDTSSLQWIT
eukprot:gb/GECG01000404.1/.p1 GENE.gb/GECG01000404.1/~~gb/GECG01000404.1/.p1  ORF type:complete len:1083 (+),score=142.27 gb/GECG01000404.1/:1-3249(+)